MSDEQVLNAGSGRFVAVLSDDDDDLPLHVRGVALGEDDITFGNDRTRIRWPRETLKAAAASLSGKKIVDPSEHWAPEGGELTADYPREPPEETWIGEVTDTYYEDGLGVMYEGLIDDPEAAEAVRNGDVEPSPTVFHERIQETDSDEWLATNITEWRDLATVDHGASAGANIEPSESAVAAMSDGEVVAALSRAFDGEGVASLASIQNLSYDGTKTGKLDESKIDSDDYKSHYMFPGDSKSESSFPVVDANGNLRRGNVESAWKMRSDAPVGEEEMADMLRTLAKKFDDPPVTEEDVASLGAGGGAGPTDDSPNGGGDEDRSGQGRDGDADADDTDNNTDMSDFDISDEEKDLVRTARTLESPTVVDESVASLGEEAAQYDEPEMLESEDYSQTMNVVNRIEEFLGGLLTEQKGLKEDTVASLSAGAMIGEFEDDEGELSVASLEQNPESGDNGADATDPDGSGDPTVGVASLSDDEREQVASLAARAETFDGFDPDYAEELRSQAAEMAGAEEFADIEEEI